MEQTTKKYLLGGMAVGVALVVLALLLKPRQKKAEPVKPTAAPAKPTAAPALTNEPVAPVVAPQNTPQPLTMAGDAHGSALEPPVPAGDPSPIFPAA